MTKILEIRHLELVSAICETRSVARAAEALHLSQPAVSHALKTLEDRLGVRLFERARRMTPTPAGAELHVEARRILPMVARSEERLRRFKTGAPGIIRVATACYTSYHWLPSVLERLQVAVPGCSVRIVGQATGRALQALLNGELEFALLNYRPPDRHLVVEKLFTDEQVLIVRPDHRLARRAFIVPADLRDEHLITHRSLDDTWFYRDFLEPADVRPAEATSMQLTEAIIESVKAGLGVAVLARWAVAQAVASGKLTAVRVGRHGLRRSWYAAMRPGRTDETLSALLAILKDDAIQSAVKTTKRR